MKTLWITTGLLLASLSAPSAWAMSIAEVAELQFHTVDQLATRNKIDKGFIDHMQSVTLVKIANSANFMVTFAQEADAGVAANTVAIEATDLSKAVAFHETRGALSTNPVNWKGVAPLDLLEKAVEYVVDTQGNPDLIAFQNGFTEAAIVPVDNGQGLSALVKVKAGAQDGVLSISIDLNGKILSAQKE